MNKTETIIYKRSPSSLTSSFRAPLLDPSVCRSERVMEVKSVLLRRVLCVDRKSFIRLMFSCQTSSIVDPGHSLTMGLGVSFDYNPGKRFIKFN